MQACDTGMQFTFAKDLRDCMPGFLMGCQLWKIPINKLDRAKMTEVLKTAMAHDEIIVNCEKEQFGRILNKYFLYTIKMVNGVFLVIGIFL